MRFQHSHQKKMSVDLIRERLNAIKAKAMKQSSSGEVEIASAPHAEVEGEVTSAPIPVSPPVEVVQPEPVSLVIDRTIKLRYRDEHDSLTEPFTSKRFVDDFIELGPDRRRQRVEEAINVRGLPRPPCRDVDVYEPDVHLDKGEYGDVFKAIETSKGPSVQFAVKQIKRARLDEYKSGFPCYLLREFDIVMRMQHPNVVRGVEVVCKTTVEEDAAKKPLPGGGKRSGFFLVAPLCATNLKRFLYDSRGRYLHFGSRNSHPDAPNVFLAKVKCIMQQLLAGIACLHENRIMHRDVKPSNVLLSEGGVLQLCDFGLGRLYREGSRQLTPTVVTLIYRAPELHLGLHDYSNKLDVWSVGCIFAELFLKFPLFRASNEAEHFQRVCDVLGMPTDETFAGFLQLGAAVSAMRGLQRHNRANKLRSEFAESHCRSADLMPPSGMSMLQDMLEWNPMMRPSARELLSHAFFNEAPVACLPEQLMKPFPFMDDGSPARRASAHNGSTAQVGPSAAPQAAASADSVDSHSVTPTGADDQYAAGFVVLESPPTDNHHESTAE